MSIENEPNHGPKEATHNTEKPICEPKEVNPILELIGFKETPEMLSMRGELVEALRHDDERISDLVGLYRGLGETVADRDSTSKGRIGLNVALALILREAGRTGDCQERLEECLSCAEQEGFNDIEIALEKLISEL